MKISTQVRYGLRALCFIAYNTEGGPTQVRSICEHEGLPPRYIEQIFQKFKRAGILNSSRGPFGGYQLAMDPRNIRVGDVIRAAEGGDIHLVFCTGLKKNKKKACERYDACVARDVWDEASRRLMAYFDSITVEDLCVAARKKKADQAGK
jgi:Rrf2 family transcriptional regulator, iron-sulfur cluster assembly transcription factor